MKRFSLVLLLGCFFSVFIFAQNIANLEATLNRAKKAYSEDNYELAIKEMTSAIMTLNGMGNDNRIVQMKGLAYGIRGMSYEAIQDFSRAINDFTEVLKTDTTDADWYFYRGRCYLQKEDYDRAITDLTQAIRINNKYKDAYVQRGFAYFYKSDLNRAIADWEAALKLAPNDANIKRLIELGKELM